MEMNANKEKSNKIVPIKESCNHDYKFTQHWDGEGYTCCKCGKYYFLDYDEMR